MWMTLNGRLDNVLVYAQRYKAMGLYDPLDGVTNLKYKLLYLLTPNKKISKRKALAFNWDRCCHLAICLRLILFHLKSKSANYTAFCYARNQSFK